MSSLFEAKHWYDRGTEMRALAEQMRKPKLTTVNGIARLSTDGECYKIMMQLADDYDVMGDHAEERKKCKTDSR